MSAADDALMLLVTCDHCGVGPGVWCQTKSRHVAQSLHGPRYWATMEPRIRYWIEQEQAVMRECQQVWEADNPAELARRHHDSAERMVESLAERLEA